MPKLSIIVPIYNVERYLRECLDSIVNQTLQDIEIICVNDGSTDHSQLVIEEYAAKDKRIKAINKLNSGYGHSMNVGLDCATGEYIGIIESDDFAEPDMFQRLYEKAVTKNAEVVKSNYYAYRSLKGIQNDFIENLKNCSYDSVFSPLEEQAVFYTSCSIWSAIYQRQFLVDNKIRFNETPGASFQDTSFLFKVWACAKRVVLVKDAFVHYRSDNAGSSVKSPDKVFCIFDEYDVIHRFLEDKQSIKAALNKVEMVLKYRAFQGFYFNLASAFQYTFLLRMTEELNKDFDGGRLQASYFNLEEWNEFERIKTNPNQYFKDTAKDYYDNRLELFPTLKVPMYMLGLLSIMDHHKKVIIYGAGVIGQKVAQKLLDNNKDKKKLCFAVTDLTPNAQEVLGIPVYRISDLKEDREESIVIVAVKESSQCDLLINLQALEFKHIILIDSLLMESLYNDICDKCYFK